jgi:hypothetical protein
VGRFEYTALLAGCMVANLVHTTIQIYVKNAMTPFHIVSHANQQLLVKTVCLVTSSQDPHAILAILSLTTVFPARTTHNASNVLMAFILIQARRNA